MFFERMAQPPTRIAYFPASYCEPSLKMLRKMTFLFLAKVVCVFLIYIYIYLHVDTPGVGSHVLGIPFLLGWMSWLGQLRHYEPSVSCVGGSH